MTSDTPSPSTADPLDARKTAFRDEARRIRNAIPPGQRAADAARMAQLPLPFLAERPGIVGGYHPTAREFDCLPLLQRLAREGWTLALPAVVGDAPLLFHRWSFGAPLVRGQRGMMQPESGEIVRPAMLLIPLLAFDARGCRLGYGGGHYDRTLEALRRDGPVLAIGVAFDAQEVAQLPAGPHDQRLDWMLTPMGARRF
jgi:5-formyltetrahydrofolate cyclo-ligase